jgi:hypothetical protein
MEKIFRFYDAVIINMNRHQSITINRLLLGFISNFYPKKIEYKLLKLRKAALKTENITM